MAESDGLGSLIFLSYAHIDNEKIDSTHRGWVDYFYTALTHELRQRKGETFHFWRDKRDLAPNDFFDNTILTAVDRSKVFIAVVSPVYLTRDYCMKELQRFVARAGAELQLRAERTLKVVKRRVHRNPSVGELPYPLGGREGFRFYILNDDDNRKEILFWDDAEGQVDPRYRKLYWEVIRQVADEVERHLRGDNRSPHPPTTDGPVVYLATSSFDQQEDYWMLRGELEQKLGALIVPEDFELPNMEAHALAAIDGALERAAISVHLLGRTSGHTPDGSTRTSIVPLQLERAEAKARSCPGFRRIIWLPPGLNPADSQQQQLIDALQSGGRLMVTDELVCEPLERFKNHAIDCIRRATGNKSYTVMEGAGPINLFLLCQPEDEAAALTLRRMLFDRGIEVQMPEFEGSKAAQDEAFIHHAVSADAVLVYLGAGLESWVIAMLDRLSGWEALGRKRAYTSRAVLIGAEASARKHSFASHRADLIISARDISIELAVDRYLQGLGGGN